MINIYNIILILCAPILVMDVSRSGKLTGCSLYCHVIEYNDILYLIKTKLTPLFLVRANNKQILSDGKLHNAQCILSSKYATDKICHSKILLIFYSETELANNIL